MKDYLLPVILQVTGFLVIVTEVFVPSMGLLTVLALGIYAYSLYLVFTTISSTAGMIFTGIDLVAVPVMLIIGMKMIARSPLSLKKELSKDKGVVSQKRELSQYLNQKGESVTDLRPAGAAMINSVRVDVVTDGEYIERGTPVWVTGISGNRIVVEAMKNEETDKWT